MAMENHRQITEEFRNGILPPLNKGLAAISSLTHAINGINPNSIRQSECEKILSLISTANRETQRATETAHQKLQNLNNKCERLIKEKKTLKDKMKSKEDDLQKQKTQMDRLEEEKEERDRDLSRNQSELAEANENKRKAQRDHEDAETAALVSAAVMLIPIVGTIAGGISLAVSLSLCKAAEKRCHELEDMADKYRRIISDIKEKMRNLRRQQKKVSEEIKKMKQDLSDLDEKLRETKKLIENMTSVQSMMKQCTAFLSQLNGKADVMEITSAEILDLKQTCNLLKDIIGHLESGANSRAIRPMLPLASIMPPIIPPTLALPETGPEWDTLQEFL